MKLNEMDRTVVTKEQSDVIDALLAENPDRGRTVIGDLAQGLKHTMDASYAKLGQAFIKGDVKAALEAHQEIIQNCAAGNALVESPQARRIREEEPPPRRGRGEIPQELRSLFGL